jgi:hypothetical protein
MLNLGKIMGIKKTCKLAASIAVAMTGASLLTASPVS